MVRSSDTSSRPKRKTRRRPKVDIAKTALGVEPEKRTRKSVASASSSQKTGKPKKDTSSATDATASAGVRDLAVNVKTAKYRKTSSTLWLKRQLNDPYVARAKADGFRSRAAYKLLELDEKFSLLKPGARIVDLGCAPGGWLQVATRRVGERGHVVGIDYLSIDTVPGADVLELDFLYETAPEALKALLNGDAHLVLSDMAAPTTGHRPTDHLRIIGLAEAALDFAIDVLAPEGAFVCKVFQGGAEGTLLTRLKTHFRTVKHAKPKASRQESAEMYVVALGFRGIQE